MANFDHHVALGTRYKSQTQPTDTADAIVAAASRDSLNHKDRLRLWESVLHAHHIEPKVV